MKTYVWSILLCGCETWCLSEREIKRLEAFEMWAYRRILGISWRDHVTNEEVLSRVEERRHLVNTMAERRARCMGHIFREESLLHLIVEGMVEGTNSRGCPRKDYISQICGDMGCASMIELKRTAEDREEWRRRCGVLLLPQTNPLD